MKKLILLITVLTFFGCDKDTTAPGGTGGVNTDNLTELEGNWNGYVVNLSSGWTLIMSGSVCSVTDGNDEWYMGTVSINTQTNPKQIDVVITASAYSPYIGTTALGIYKIENNTLTFAAYEPGTTSRPTSFNDSYARVFILTKQ